MAELLGPAEYIVPPSLLYRRTASVHRQLPFFGQRRWSAQLAKWAASKKHEAVQDDQYPIWGSPVLTAFRLRTLDRRILSDLGAATE